MSKKNKKSVWLINQYLTTPDLDGDGHRHSYLGEEWIKKGYDVTLITSSYSHIGNRNNPIKGFFKIYNNSVRTLLIKGNVYKNTNGISRILSWLIFSFLLFFIPIKKLPKPDIIIVSSISLLPIINVIFFFKKRIKNVKFILEIRDIWPLSIIEIGGFSSKNLLVKFLSYVEKLGYKNADHIVSLLMDCNEHIAETIGTNNFKYTWVSNGYSIENESYYKPLPKEITEKIPDNKFIIGYAGALGKANAMETIIDALNELKTKEIVLCLLGYGNEKKKLIKRAKNNKNIIFFDAVSKNQVQSFLEKCDLLFFSSKNLNIYKYGISANKTFDYMYAGKPIVLSAPTKNNVIELAGSGFVVEPENKKSLLEAIKRIKDMSEKERQAMGEKGKKYLLEHFTYSKLASKYIHIFKTFNE